MKYFVISDIHSYFDEMITSLSNHSFDSSNPKHHLLVLGDLFDRGPKTKEVLNYLYTLSKKGKCTIILGNHDVFLLEILSEKYDKVMFNVKHNGHGETLEQLTGIKANEDNLYQIRSKIVEKYPYLYDWISSFPLYLEMGKYIFVHGGIDGSNENWRSETSRRDFVWGQEFLLPRVKDKIVVCGHTRVATLKAETKNYNLLYKLRPEYFDILELEGKIMIDRFVEITRELNVLKIEL